MRALLRRAFPLLVPHSVGNCVLGPQSEQGLGTRLGFSESKHIGGCLMGQEAGTWGGARRIRDALGPNRRSVLLHYGPTV